MNIARYPGIARLLACTLLVAATSAAAASADFRLFAIGEARNAVDGELRYREYHLESAAEPVRVVEYREPDGALIASKTVHPGADPAAPGFIQLDLRSGELLSARWQQQNLQLARRGGEDAASDTREFAPAKGSALVIDAGFDDFVRAQWDTLQRGERVTFDFALPARLGLVGLQAQTVPCAGGDNLACFRIEPSNRLLRLVAKPIDLAYTVTDRRLARFQGIANIQSPGGESGAVSITYTYPEARPLPGCQPVVFRDSVPPLDTLAAGCQVAAGD